MDIMIWICFLQQLGICFALCLWKCVGLLYLPTIVSACSVTAICSNVQAVTSQHAPTGHLCILYTAARFELATFSLTPLAAD
jgi:hypothetical protein